MAALSSFTNWWQLSRKPTGSTNHSPSAGLIWPMPIRAVHWWQLFRTPTGSTNQSPSAGLIWPMPIGVFIDGSCSGRPQEAQINHHLLAWFGQCLWECSPWPNWLTLGNYHTPSRHSSQFLPQPECSGHLKVLDQWPLFSYSLVFTRVTLSLWLFSIQWCWPSLTQSPNTNTWATISHRVGEPIPFIWNNTVKFLDWSIHPGS